LVAGGAFIQQGVLYPYTTIALGLLGVVLGDTLSYGIGHLLRRPIQRRYGQSAAWLRAEAYFARRATIAIFLTRCVLTPIALPINLIAGSSDYPLGRFVAYVGAGELTWLLSYGALGYLFGSQWEYVSDLISNASGLLLGLVIAGAGAYALIRWQRRPALAPVESVEPVAPVG
jgi:membrane-associated protein